jgi:hypothetical protein
MRLFAATFILSLFLGTAALAGGPSSDGPEQRVAQKTIVVQPDNDNTGLIIVAALGLIGTLGAAIITTRNRKG